MQKDLDSRLALAASMVRKGSVVADIGCDHALLPIYLVENGICERALACDLRIGPLRSAEENIKRAGLSEKISTRLSDGLDRVREDEADAIIMAGMGGLLIIEIIGRTPWLKNPAKRLILQPMTDAHELRYFLYTNGFEILEERAALASKRLYSAMRVQHTGRILESPSPVLCRVGLLSKEPFQYEKDYIKREICRLKKQVHGQKKSANPDRGLIDREEEVIKGLSALFERIK